MTLNRRELETEFSRGRVAASVVLLLGIAALVLGLSSPARLVGSRSASSPSMLPQAPSQVGPAHARFAEMPMFFEPNQGQTDNSVKFLARGNGYGLFLTADQAVLALRQGGKSKSNSAVIRMALANAKRDAAVTGDQRLPGVSNYFLGNRHSEWHSDIPQFARVRYSGVYPGVDLVYYGKQQQLEYDFEVAANADPRQIELQFQGTDRLRLAENGDLILATQGGEVRLQAPRVYQRAEGKQQDVAGHFALRGDHAVGFELGDYDRSRTLVIDPVLSYSTYLGGSLDEACSVITGSGIPQSGCPAITVDTAFSVYLAGTTSSTNFPAVGNALSGPTDVFIFKFNPSSNTVLYSTYLGGSGTEFSEGIAVDTGCVINGVNGFCAYVTGTTDSSTDFPTTANAVQVGPVSAGFHAFATQLNNSGAVAYSTYLASTGTDIGTGIAVDFHDKIHVTGSTTCPSAPGTSCNFPVTAGTFQSTPKAINQFFYSQIDPAAVSGSIGLLYSTYIGGSSPANGVAIGGGIAVDATPSPAAYMTGTTSFTDMPTLNAALGPPGGGGTTDAFLAKFIPANPTGSQLIYLTYVGGSGSDTGTGIAVDTATNVYMTGTTNSTDFTTKMPLPTGVVPFQGTFGGVTDAYVGKFGVLCTGTTCTTNNVPFNYFSYLGGSSAELGLAIAADSGQGAWMTGLTASSNLPVKNSFSGGGGPQGGNDAFVARIDTTATSADAPGHTVSYLGGSGNDAGTGIALDSLTATYVAGETQSSNFPVATPFQGALSGTSDAFMTRLTPAVNLTVTAAATPSPDSIGNQVTFTYTITNVGDQTNGVIFTDFLPTSGAVFNGATPSTCGGAVGSPPTVTCALGTINSGGVATVTIKLTPSVAGNLTNSGTVSISAGSSFTASASATVSVFGYDFTVSPASNTVIAGVPATYTLNVIPTGTPFPGSISPSCGGPLPTGASCTFTPSSLPNLNNGAASTTLVVNTTARPKTTGALWRGGGISYAAWLPVSGLALMGVGIGGTISRRRRWLAGLFLGMVFAFVGLQAGCGGGSSTVPAGGTPAGTYQLTITAKSGTASVSHTAQLVVQ